MTTATNSSSAVSELDGERVDAGPGMLVCTRSGVDGTAVATEAGTVVLAIDGSPGTAYTPTGWEVWAPLVPRYEGGQYAELVAALTEPDRDADTRR